MKNPIVKHFFDQATWTLTYVVHDPATKDAVIIDPVWDFEPESSKLSTQSLDQIVQYVKSQNLKVHYILETHAHADHISSSQVLKTNFVDSKIGIGAKITEVQKVFKNFFNLGSGFKTDGSQFDILLQEDKNIYAGSLKIQTLFTPGHTPACTSLVIGDAVFTGDALFMPDYGTGRCDFPAGSADDLYTSVQEKLYVLPDHFRVFVGHDYMPEGRPLAYESTIHEEKNKNIHIKKETERAEFVNLRQTRDKTLAAPKLLLASVQLNIDAGQLPQPENNEARYLKIPIK